MSSATRGSSAGSVIAERPKDRASAAASWPFRHYPTFLSTDGPDSCMRLLGSEPARWTPRVHCSTLT